MSVVYVTVKLLSVINSACQLLCAIIKIIFSLPTAFVFFENHFKGPVQGIHYHL